MALTKISTDTINLSSDTTALKMPKGTTAERPAAVDSTIGETRENTTTGKMEIYTGAKGWRALQQTGQDVGVVPSNNFNTTLYPNTANDQSITGVGFKPDLTWVKSRDYGYPNILADSVRGLGNNKMLISDFYGEEGSTDASYANCQVYGYISSLDTDGFSVAAGTTNGSYVGANGVGDYVSWNWKAGGSSNIFNIDGVGYATAAAAGMNTGTNPPSACSVNTETGFSIIKNTSPSGAYTWDHGLSKAPEIWIHKAIDYVYGWETMYPKTFAQSSGSSSPSDWNTAFLNTNAAANTSQTIYAATNTLLSSTGWGQVNDFITYAWHSVPGYSLIGSYTGTGSATDSPKIYTGFEPAWIMVKRTDSTGDWNIVDNKRSISNPRTIELAANDSAAETTPGDLVDFDEGGFQIITTDTGWNTFTGNYIFMCFAS